MSEKPPIPGFTPHGDRYRAPVSLAEEDARDVSDEAADRGVRVSVVLMERVRKKRRKERPIPVRTSLTCAARGCDGCRVCEPTRYANLNSDDDRSKE